MSEPEEQEKRDLARSGCVWEATLEGAHYGLYGLAAGLTGVLAAHNLWPGFRTLNTSARTAMAISPAAFLFAFCGEEKLVECMRDKTRQEYRRRKDS